MNPDEIDLLYDTMIAEYKKEEAAAEERKGEKESKRPRKLMGRTRTNSSYSRGGGGDETTTENKIPIASRVSAYEIKTVKYSQQHNRSNL